MGFANILDYVILVLGIVIMVYGIVMCILRKPELTLDYNWLKVKKEDVSKYTIAYGVAYSIMGAFMTILGASRILFEGEYRGIVFILYFVVYLIFMVATKRIQKKYTGSN